MPKVCKQGRDDINVKLNTQSLTAASFLTLEYNCTIKKCMGYMALFIYLHVNIITTSSVFFLVSALFLFSKKKISFKCNHNPRTAMTVSKHAACQLEEPTTLHTRFRGLSEADFLISWSHHMTTDQPHRNCTDRE